MDFKFNFLSALEENKGQSALPPRKPKESIPPRKESSLKVPPRKISKLDALLLTRTHESVIREIEKSWTMYQAENNDPSITTDLIIDDLLRWIGLSNDNKLLVYKNLLILTGTTPDSEAKERTIEYLYSELDRIK